MKNKNTLNSTDNKMDYFLALIKNSPEECPTILRGLKARLMLKNNDEENIDDICEVLAAVLQADKTLCGQLLEILPIIFHKHNRIPYSLLIDIAHTNTTYSKQSFDLLKNWLIGGIWNERNLVHLYQILEMYLSKHPEQNEDIFETISIALTLDANGGFSRSEAQNVLQNLAQLNPQLKVYA